MIRLKHRLLLNTKDKFHRDLIRWIIIRLDSSPVTNWKWELKPSKSFVDMMSLGNIELSANLIVKPTNSYNAQIIITMSDLSSIEVLYSDIGMYLRWKLRRAVIKYIETTRCDDIGSYLMGRDKKDLAIVELLRAIPGGAAKYANHLELGNLAQSILEDS